MACPIAASSSTGCSADTNARRAGFILIPVIWMVFFMALAVAGFTLAIRANVQHTASTAASAESGALADAGIHIAILDLVNGQADRARRRRFPPDGRTHDCSIGQNRVSIRVADEAGKIDLNQAGERHFRALLRGLGVSAIDASRIAAAILDFRDSDSMRTPGGAEAPEYHQAGRPDGPKNAPFDAVLEISHVLGISEPLLSKILPHVTVSSGATGVDPEKASPALIAILSAGAFDAAPSPDTSSELSPTSRLPAELSAASMQRAFSIIAQARGELGGTFAREAVVRLTPSSRQPYEVITWQQINAVPDLAGTDLGPC